MFVCSPGAGHGLWLILLVPFAYWTNYIKHFNVLEFQYKLSTFLVTGLVLQSIIIFHSINQSKHIWTPTEAIVYILPGLFTSLPIWLCLNQCKCIGLIGTYYCIRFCLCFPAIPFSLLCSFVTLFVYEWLFRRILRSLPKSFTIGEASIVTQGLVLMLVNTFVMLIDYSHHIPTTDMQQMSAIIQVVCYTIWNWMSDLYIIYVVRLHCWAWFWSWYLSIWLVFCGDIYFIQFV